MNTIILAIGLIAFGQGAATSADQKAVMAVVNLFTDAFNKGDTKTAASTCAEQTSIIDEFPPHEWHGAGGCAKWMADYDADAKKNGITDGTVKLGTAKHVDVTADHAYVVMPADYTYKMKGKVVKETASLLTVALQKSASGWKITGWSWSKN
jgi:ketosteroid isomerase-like protein